MIEISSHADLTTDAVQRIAWAGERLWLDSVLLAAVDQARSVMLGALASGARVYGVNTGTGYLAGSDVDPDGAYSLDLLRGRAVGAPPYLPWAESRAVLAVRLRNLLSGVAGVSGALCSFLVDRLNDGFVPAVPRRSIGSAGDLIPLAHAMQALAGLGSVVTPDGTVQPAAQALADRGATPYRPLAKEGIALLAGSPATAALGVARGRQARQVAAQALAVAAASIDALHAPLGPYGAALGRLSGDPLVAEACAAITRYVGVGDDRGTRPGQAPVSFRVVPQVHAALERASRRFAADVDRALCSVSDSPAFTDGEFVTSGEFHAVGVAAGMDTLSAALVRVAELSAQRLHRLLDRRFSGLADQLASEPGPRTGMVVVHKRAVGVVACLRRRATPVSIGLVDTSLGQEDAMTFSFGAAENLQAVAAGTREVLACELLAVRQAWWLADRSVPRGLEELAATLAELVAPVDVDRPLGVDIDALTAALASGWLASEGAAPAGPAPL